MPNELLENSVSYIFDDADRALAVGRGAELKPEVLIRTLSAKMLHTPETVHPGISRSNLMLELLNTVTAISST